MRGQPGEAGDDAQRPVAASLHLRTRGLAEKREVTLGITDGTNVQVTDGLSEGDEILLFVPNKDTVRTGKPNTCEADMSVCYDDNGKEIL